MKMANMRKWMWDNMHKLYVFLELIFKALAQNPVCACCDIQVIDVEIVADIESLEVDSQVYRS